MDLKVKVLKKFKQDLDDRFNPENAKFGYNGYVINHHCLLCSKYKKCKGCPFEKFKEKNAVGCYVWMNNILNGKLGISPLGISALIIWWGKEEDKQARKQLKDLREKALELIEFY